MTENRPIRSELDNLVRDLKTLRDEIRVQVRLGSAEVQEKWKTDLEPRIGDVERSAKEAGQQAVDAVTALATDLKKSFEAFKERLTS